MNLMRDVLDQQIIDNQGEKAGKVDGIAMEIRENAPPRIAALEVGTKVLARRLRRRGERKSFQIPWSKVRVVSIYVHADIDIEKTPAFRAEKWIRDHIIRYIPVHSHGHPHGTEEEQE